MKGKGTNPKVTQESRRAEESSWCNVMEASSDFLRSSETVCQGSQRELEGAKGDAAHSWPPHRLPYLLQEDVLSFLPALGHRSASASSQPASGLLHQPHASKRTELPHDPAIPLPGIHTEETRSERDMCTPMFIEALFIIARAWKQPRCPSADEWIRKLWYIYTIEYYSAIKKNTFESVLMRWMKLEPII